MTKEIEIKVSSDKLSDDTYIKEKGYRRDAIVYPTDVSVRYDKNTNKCKVKFTLPKASYATVLIENIANRNLKA